MRHLDVASSHSAVDELRSRIASSFAGPFNRLPRPSWSALIVASAAVAGLTYGVMQRRAPEIDARQVIATNLTTAQLAIEDARYVDPPEYSAAHYYRMVLAIDPTNEAARTGLQQIAEQLIGTAKSAILDGRFADAVEAIEHTRRIAPQHRRIAFVEAEMQKALEARAAAVRSERVSNETSLSSATPAASSVAPTRRSNAQPTQAHPSAAAEVPEPIKTKAELNRDVDREELVIASQLPNVAAAYQTARHAIETQELEARELVAAAVPSAPLETHSISSAVAQPVAEPKVIRMVQPEYPHSARIRGMQGWVDLSLSVSPSGEVVEARVKARKGGKSFERAALAAVRKWKYESIAASGLSVPQDVPVRVEFRLEE